MAFKSIETFLENGVANNCNYFEFIVARQPKTVVNDAFQIVDTSLSKEDFYDTMCKFMSRNYKYTQKQYKELIIGSTHYHNHRNEETYIFDLKTVCVDVSSNNMVATGFIKNKLTMLSVPSTRKFHVEGWIKRLSFHVTNRVMVHFINGKHSNTFYKIVVAYNHEKNVDTSYAIQSLNSILKQFEESTFDGNYALACT